MLRVFCLGFLFSSTILNIKAQCSLEDVTIPTQVCLQGNFVVANNSTANSFEWDFCPEDLRAIPTASKVVNTGMSSTLDITVAKDNDKFFGFAVDANSNSLLRLDFENTIENVPVKVSLGNVGGLFQFPNSITINREAGGWLGVVANAGNSKIILLNFGESLKNVPTATVLHERAGGGFANITVSETSVAGRALLIAEFNSGRVTVLNYPQGFLNGPDHQESVAIAGSTPIDVQLYRQCENWTAVVLSFENRKLYHLDFGSSMLNTPLASEYGFVFNFEPYRLSLSREGDLHYGFVTSTSGGLSRLDFGFDFHSIPTVVQLGSFGVLANSRSLHVESDGGAWNALMVNFSDGDLYRLSFKQNCGASPEYFVGSNPAFIKYDQPGNQKIVVTAYNNDGVVLISSHQVTVASEIAPDFNIKEIDACIDHEISFEAFDVAGSIANYEWTFGDGNTSDEAGPSHAYSTPGTYIASLRVTAANFCTNQKQISVPVFDKPESRFLMPANTPLCTNQELLFENTSLYHMDSDPVWRWFVNDEEVSHEPDLQYAMTSPAPQTIRLMVTIAGCQSDSEQTLNNLVEGPDVDFDFSGICYGDVTTFVNKSSGDIDSFAWTFGDGNISTQLNPFNNFGASGTYAVRLTATDPVGCNNAQTKQVTIHSNPVIDFQVYPPPLSCTGRPTQFYNESTNPDGNEITGWHWDFHDGNNNSIALIEHPLHTFQDSGRYDVTVTGVTRSGCKTTLEKQINIFQSPDSNFTFSPACDDKPVTFNGPLDRDKVVDWYWEIGTAYYITPSPVHTFRTPGTHQVFMEVTGSNGCTSEVLRTIEVAEPLVPDFSFTKNCVEHETVFNDLTTGSDPVATREWNFNGAGTATTPVANFMFGTVGIKTVQLAIISESGCQYQVSKKIDIVHSPIASFIADPASGAQPLEVRFLNTSSHASNYQWRFFDEVESASTDVSPTYTFEHSGTFEVALTASNNQQCDDTFATVISTTAPLPDVDIDLINLSRNAEGSLKIIITVNNKGNTIVRNLPLEIDFSGKVKLREMILQSIPPESQYNFVLSPSLSDVESQRYVCVSAILGNDLNPEGNRICKEFGPELLIFPAYPNPIKTLMNVEWITANGAPVALSIVDLLGRQVFQANVTSEPGHNRKVVDVGRIGNGIYHLLINDGFTRSTQRIFISSHP